MCWSTRIILVIDRDDEVLKFLRTAMRSSDFVIFHATTGKEALAVMSRLKFPIDLAIIDLELPNDDGLVITLLTILGGKKTSKIIVKTSRQDKPFLEQVNYFGIDALVMKPIAEEQLIKAVKEALNNNRNSSAGVSAESAA